METTTMARLLSVLSLLLTCRHGISSTTSSSSPAVWGISSNTTIPQWKQRLPSPLQQRGTLQRILIPTSPGYCTQVYLLGTSHVSNDSSADVKLLLNHVRPDVVFLELCDQRAGMLTPNNVNWDANATFWEQVHQVQQNEGMTRASALGTVLLTTVQHDYAESLGVELGSEFRVAHDYCLASHPTTCILGDRPLQITLVRAWESLRWWGKTKVLLGLLWSCIRRTDAQELREWMQRILIEGESDVLTTSIAELRHHFPSLERVIIQERDAYMACKLYQCCRILPRRENHTVVAIVGAGHCPGICSWLTNSTESRTPEEILSTLVDTKKWNGDMVQSLITDVIQLSMRHV